MKNFLMEFPKGTQEMAKLGYCPKDFNLKHKLYLSYFAPQKRHL